MLWIKLVNDGSGTEERASYDYVVGVNELIVAEGKVKNHTRSLGWVHLVRRLLEQEEKKRGGSNVD